MGRVPTNMSSVLLNSNQHWACSLLNIPDSEFCCKVMPPETLPEKFHWHFSWVSWICLARGSVYLRISHFNWSTIALSRILNWDHLENILWTFAWTHPSKSALTPHSIAGSATKTNFEGCLYGFVWSLPELFFFFFFKACWLSYSLVNILCNFFSSTELSVEFESLIFR